MRTDVRSTDPQTTPAGRPFGSHFMGSSNPTLWVFRIPRSSRLADWKHPPGDYHTPLGHPVGGIPRTQKENAMNTRPAPGTPAYFADRAEAFAIIRELEEAAGDMSRAFDVYQVAAWDTSSETFDGNFDQFVEHRGAQLHAADERYEEVLSRARSHPTVREILAAQGKEGLLKDWLLAA